MIGLGPGETARRRWGGSDGLPPGGGGGVREEKIYLAVSVDALQQRGTPAWCECVRCRGTGAINGQQRQRWDVWPTLCGLLSILGEDSGK